MKILNKINYIQDDATKPLGDGNKIIAHICNDQNKWGSGFVVALSKRWKKPEKVYREKKFYRLGTVDYIDVENEIFVANMIAQHNTGIDYNGDIPLRYSALVDCLRDLDEMAEHLNASVHMPKIGSGLSGGNWDVIEQIIRETLTCNVHVYYM